MGPFMPEPSLRLPDAESLLDAIRSPEWMRLPHPGKWQVRSDWLVDLIGEIAPSPGGIVSNVDIQREAERRLGIEAQPENGSALSVLVYNAQGFRRSDGLIAEGYSPLDGGMLSRAGIGGKIEDVAGRVYNVREVGGMVYLMKPGARRYGIALTGQPARIVKYGRAVAV